ARRRALERGQHQVVRDQDRETADQGDAPAAAMRADRERKRDQPEDQGGYRQGVALVSLDLERGAAARIVLELGDSRGEIAERKILLGLLHACRALQGRGRQALVIEVETRVAVARPAGRSASRGRAV